MIAIRQDNDTRPGGTMAVTDTKSWKGCAKDEGESDAKEMSPVDGGGCGAD